MSAGLQGYPFQLLENTPQALWSNLFIIMEMSDGVERWRECEEVGLARILECNTQALNSKTGQRLDLEQSRNNI